MNIMGIMGIGLALSLLANAGLGWMLKGAWQDVATERANVQIVKDELVTQREALAQVQEHYENEQAKVVVLNQEANAIVIERDEAVAVLTNMRAKMHKAAAGRPTLVQRYMNRATEKVMCDVALATGGSC